MSGKISIAFISPNLKGPSELTWDGKYVDRHGERLRRANGFRLARNSLWKVFPFNPTGFLAFQGRIFEYVNI